MGDHVTVRVLDVDLDRERISLSLKATQADPWQEFANAHRVGELVYGRVTKLVPFGAFVQVGDGIEGLVHISEMAVHHVDQPDQVVSPGEELWVKIIDIDLARRRISLSIKQAAEGGEVAAEYREAFGEHAYDEHGNYIGAASYTAFEPESEAQAAWAGYLEEQAHSQEPGEPGRQDGTVSAGTARTLRTAQLDGRTARFRTARFRTAQFRTAQFRTARWRPTPLALFPKRRPVSKTAAPAELISQALTPPPKRAFPARESRAATNSPRRRRPARP